MVYSKNVLLKGDDRVGMAYIKFGLDGLYERGLLFVSDKSGSGFC